MASSKSKIDDHARIFSLWLLEKLILLRYGRDGWEFFLWDKTPYPMGIPFWNQIKWGYKWLLNPKLPKQDDEKASKKNS